MWILHMSIAASILILFITVVRAVLLNKLPPKTFIILWGMALLRLLIPVDLPSKFSVFTLIQNTTSIPLVQRTGHSHPNIGVAETVPSAGADMPNGFVQMSISPLLILWLAGMLAAALFIIIIHLHCRQNYKMALPIENAFISKWQKEHPIRRTIQIKQSDKITAPLTYGILRPVILLPKSMNDADEYKLEYILVHELTHIKRLDVLLKCLLAVSLCIHWFNPLVWAMYILANRDIEISCDKAVVRKFGETAKSAYALTLISLEEKKIRLNPLCSSFSKNAIEERITSIMKIKKTSIAGITLAVVLITGTTTVFATSAEAPNSGDAIKSYSFEDENGKTSTSDGKNIQQARRIDSTDLSGNTSFITKEEAAKINGETPKPRERSEEELKQIIADIESGKIKPLDLDSLSDADTAVFIDSDGNETVLKRASTVKERSALDTLNSR